MRLKTEIWVKAYLRARMSAGGMGVVVRHGDDDAGAIYLRINRLDGTSLLFGPAPAGLDQQESDRRFVPVLSPEPRPDAEVEAFLAREASFDPDLWIVEVEARDGSHGLESWL